MNFKRFTIVLIIFIHLFCFSRKRNFNPANKIHLVVTSNTTTDRACLYEIVPPLTENNNPSCLAIPIEKKWEKCKILPAQDDLEANQEKKIKNQILRVLSDISLNYKDLKKNISTAIFLGKDGYDSKNSKNIQKELEQSLAKFNVESKIWISNDPDNLEILLYSKPIEESWNIIELNLNSINITYSPSGKNKLQKVYKEKVGFLDLWKDDGGVKEFSSCRQAFSPFLRSTGGTGSSNFEDCKGFVKGKLEKLKSLNSGNFQEDSKFIGLGRSFQYVVEYFKSNEISRSKINESVEDACFLSILELMNKFKISKEASKNLCYSLSLVDAVLEKSGKESIFIPEETELSKIVSIHPKLFPDCDPNYK